MRHSKRFVAAVATGLLTAALPLASTQAATYTPAEQANMKVVADFYAALDEGDAHGDMKQRIRSIAEKYLRPDYTQHSERMQAYGPGREGFIKLFLGMANRPSPMPGAAAGGPPPGPMPPAKVMALWAEGDLVVRISSRNMGGKDSVIFNLFRLKDGKLAEHWEGGGMPAMAPLVDRQERADRRPARRELPRGDIETAV